MSRRPVQVVPVVAMLGASLVMIAAARAQTPIPFGVGRPDAPLVAGPLGTVGTWIVAEQSRFYRALSAAIRAWREDGTALWGLLGLSLAYGVFHAAGPGHGKAVISAYLFAGEGVLRRGIVLACAAAFVQALSAIALVSLLAFALNETARTMDAAALGLERAAALAMVGVGAWLVWRKGRALAGLLRPGGAVHVHSADCGHAPLPSPRQSLREAAGTVAAIGIRPCTGAIIVLVFSLAQGVFAAGIAATFAMALGTAVTVSAIAAIAVGAKGLALRLAAPGGRGGAIALGGLEILAGLAVLLLGLALFAGLSAGLG